MAVRPHASQHDAIGDLPLVTERAMVTAVEAMDRDRREEARAAIRAGLPEDLEALADAEPERLRTALVERGRPSLARRLGSVVERLERSRPMLVRAELVTDEPFDYLAGQYVGLRYGGSSRAYSLSSSPNSDHLEICVRRVPKGRLSPKLCGDLEVGDELTVRGPHGDLVPNDPSPRDQVFLATGTGVAPFKGMIDYLFEESLDKYDGGRRDVWLFLGAAWEDDLPYREAFHEHASEHENFHFVPCLSREPYLSKWDGETAYVQHAMLKHVDPAAVTAPVGLRVEERIARTPDSAVDARLDPNGMEVYACGLNAMVYELVETVGKLGVPEDRIDSEGFG